jgi:hypothetical protein
VVPLILQVDYRHDEEWNSWNIVAKKRILHDDGNNVSQRQVRERPLTNYSVSLRRVSGTGTQVSSLGSTNSPSLYQGSGDKDSEDQPTDEMMTAEDDQPTDEMMTAEEVEDQCTPTQEGRVSIEQVAQDTTSVGTEQNASERVSKGTRRVMFLR